MNWKVAALILAVTGILAAIGLVLFKRRTVSGFANQGSGDLSPSMPTFTMYYADWCPHCQAAKPEFKAWADKGPHSAGGKQCQIRMISSEEDPEVMKAKGITGFPTFLLETAGGEPVEYKGPRKVDDYVAFLNEKLGGGI